MIGRMRKRGLVAWYLIAALLFLGMVPRSAFAVWINTGPEGSLPNRIEDLKQIQKFLEMEIVKKRLERLGYSEDEIKNRLSLLTDSDIHFLANHLEGIKPAGDGGVAVLVVLLILLTVLLIIYVTGHKVVITK